MTKRIFITFFIFLMTAIFILGGTLIMFSAAGTDKNLVYRLEFKDSENLGKNTSGSEIPDAVINGKVEPDKHGDSFAVSLRSAGARKNYISVPAEVMNYDEVTVAGWYRIDKDLPNFSRLWSVGGAKPLDVMPSHSGHYEGWCIYSGYEFPKPEKDPGGWSNMPGLYGQLAMYDVWVNYAFTLSKDGFKAYQNGKLLWEEKGDFSGKLFYSEGGSLLLGATALDDTPDVSADYSDFRVYNKVLTGDEISEAFGITYKDALTASYDFENNFTDSVRGYRGKMVGNAKTGEKYDSVNGVLVLDGTVKNGQKTSAELNAKTFVGHHELTILFDLYVSDKTGAYSRIIEINGLDNGARRLTVAANWAGSFNFAIQYTKSNTENEMFSTFTPTYNKWVKYALVLDGKTISVYADGVKIHEAPCSWTDNIFYDGAHFSKAMISIGRTQYWGDDPLTGAMDDLRVYSAALSEREVLIESGIIEEEDDLKAISAQADALKLEYDGISSVIELPKKLGDGVGVEWKSSDEDVISPEGYVFHSDEEKTVTLTAVLSRLGKEKEKEFRITVKKAVEIDNTLFNGTPLESVHFEKGSYYENLMKANLDYMMSLGKDKLLYSYRKLSGRDVKGATSYGAWISPTSGGAGQFEAHYLLSLIKAYRTMPGYEYKGETLLDRIEYMVRELRECQLSFAALYPEEAGYLGGFSPDSFDALAEGRKTNKDGVNIWVPWYMNHKNMEMELDLYLYGPTEELRQLGYEMMVDHADWAYRKFSSYSESVRNKVMNTEYGGMGEVLYQIYAITRKPNHLKAAKMFEQRAFLDMIYEGSDALQNLHSNTTIPKFLAAAAAYETTGEEYYRQICVNAFDLIVDRCYSNGGTSRDEHWVDRPDALTLKKEGPETCCTYNMLKLADYLYRWTGDVKYLNYFENAYLNHILASMDPDSGLKCYLMSTDFGYPKIFHSKVNSFWCCAATGTESFAKLTYGLYYTDDKGVTVNLFLPSTFSYKEGITLTQSGDFITEQKTVITVSGNGKFDIRLRVPEWSEGFTIEINGVKADVNAVNGFAVISREWKDGDKIEYSVPFGYRLVGLNSKGNEKALFYGPVMFALDMGKIKGTDIKSSQLDFGEEYDGSLRKTAAIYENISDNCRVETDGDDLVLYLNTANQGELTFRPFFRLFHRRYAMYLNYTTIPAPDEPAVSTSESEPVNPVTTDEIGQTVSPKSEKRISPAIWIAAAAGVLAIGAIILVTKIKKKKQN